MLPLKLLHVVQAYGMAIVDGAPIFVLTNYNVTVFFKRSQDVRDMRLWASEPLWISDTDPPACAMWAHALQQVEELQSWKPMLPRADVPINVEEQQTQTHQQQVDTQRQRLARVRLHSTDQSSASAGSAASDDSAASSRKRKRTDEQPGEDHRAPIDAVRQRTADASMHLQACKPLSKAYETNSHTSPALEPSIGLEMEETVPLSELGLTGECLGAFQYGFTLKVSLRPPNASAPALEAPALDIHILILPTLSTSITMYPVCLIICLAKAPD